MKKFMGYGHFCLRLSLFDLRLVFSAYGIDLVFVTCGWNLVWSFCGGNSTSNFLGMEFSCRKSPKSQAPIKLVQPFPAPELRSEYLPTLDFSWATLGVTLRTHHIGTDPDKLPLSTTRLHKHLHLLREVLPWTGKSCFSNLITTNHALVNAVFEAPKCL